MEEKSFDFKRWYDFDPTVSLAIKLLSEASEKAQIRCADFIIEQSRNRGVILNKTKKDFDYVWLRWQDRNEKLFYAMECYKMLDNASKMQISLEIIKILRQN